jgi:uncharacterized protein YecE (DUF72 family)
VNNLVVGCCGWAYNDWRGPFYPVATASADYLSLYAQSFGTVEVDSTFYGPPTEATVRTWEERTPEHFRFALKVPQVVTHEKKLRDAHGDFEDFLATTGALGRKRGPLLLQFPRFSRADFEDAAEFLRVLDAFLEGVDRSVRLAVEVRNERWFDDPLLDLLRDHAAAVALTDQLGGGPPAGAPSRFVTSDFAYVRLLGNRRRIEAVTKTWDATVIDRTPELRTWAEFLVHTMAALPDLGVWVYANNHFSGHAPAAARTLAAILDAKA